LFARFVQLAILLLVFIATIVVGKQLSSGKMPPIRKLPAIDALEEAVGRASEMDRPIHATTGYGRGTITDAEYGSQHVAGMAVIAHLAKLSARKDAKLIVTLCPPEAIPVVDSSMRDAYVAEGKEDAYSPDMIRHYGTLQWGYTLGVLGLLAQEKPASNVMVGGWLAENLVIAESGCFLGALQIGGTMELDATPFFIATCNHVLIGQEIFAVSAYLSQDPKLVANVRVSDLSSIAISLMLIAAVLFATVRSDWLVNLLKL
jgi:hypothetical protein